MKPCLRILGLFLGCSSLAACAAKQEPRAELMDEKASIQYQFAYEAYNTGDLIPALTAGLRTVEMAPGNPDARNLLGLIYFRQEKYDEAEAEFKKAVELNPKLSEAHNNLGTLYYTRERYPEALQALEKATENPLYLYPERIQNNLGLVYQKMGRVREAQQAYETSMKFRKDFYLPYQNYGKLKFEQKQYKEALPLLEEASKLCSQCSEPRYYMGQALMKLNRTPDALKWFKQGAHLDPQGYFGQLCKEFLVP